MRKVMTWTQMSSYYHFYSTYYSATTSRSFTQLRSLFDSPYLHFSLGEQKQRASPLVCTQPRLLTASPLTGGPRNEEVGSSQHTAGWSRGLLLLLGILAQSQDRSFEEEKNKNLKALRPSSFTLFNTVNLSPPLNSLGSLK